MKAPATIIAGARLLELPEAGYRAPCDLLIEDGMVRAVDPGPIEVEGARRIDVGGRVVMPGLIDAHVHVIAVDEDFTGLARLSPFLLAARTSRVLADMLERGFTTVRDAGGADAGLRAAVAGGHFRGPRLFVCDRGLAQTGGQGDFRLAGQAHLGCEHCGGRRSITRVVDGVEAIRLAAREMLRDGADQIKVFASGGIASGIPIDRPQFTREELRVMVEEAERCGTYVMAHAYQDEAVRRCLEAGIRSIEHASHIDDETCKRLLDAGATIVPTLVVYDAHAGQSPRFAAMLEASLESLARAARHGIPIGHGSDLGGASHALQSREFLLKARVQSPAEVIRSATTINAALLGEAGRLGTLRPGAHADLLVLDGDPLVDIACLAAPEAHLRLVMKAGHVELDRLDHLSSTIDGTRDR
jgi:imidazolonepropionase-like amidohydrolase